MLDTPYPQIIPGPPRPSRILTPQALQRHLDRGGLASAWQRDLQAATPLERWRLARGWLHAFALTAESDEAAGALAWIDDAATALAFELPRKRLNARLDATAERLRAASVDGAPPPRAVRLTWLAQIASPLIDLCLRGKYRIYRSIHVEVMAQAMLALAHQKSRGRFVYEHDEILRAIRRQMLEQSVRRAVHSGVPKPGTVE